MAATFCNTEISIHTKVTIAAQNLQQPILVLKKNLCCLRLGNATGQFQRQPLPQLPIHIYDTC